MIRYKRVPKDDALLRSRLEELAAERRRFPMTTARVFAGTLRQRLERNTHHAKDWMSALAIEGVKVRQAALIVGFTYLLSPVGYAEFTIWPKLVIPGHIEQTVANIASHHGLFLTAIFCYLINFIEDIILA